MSTKDKWVRRFSVNETARHKNGFTIYKITSVLFPIDSPEALTIVSVWKRYSDVQRLHASMRALHSGLHLRGNFVELTRSSYFKRFQQEVIEERAKTIKALLEFIAEHKLLFTSTDFVNFLQTGYPEPESSTSTGLINAIRSSLHLPIEETPPLEYQTSDDDSRSPAHSGRQANQSIDEPDFISQIPIYEAAEVELPPKTVTKSDSFESINSLASIDSDLCSELDKVTIDKTKPLVKKNVLPDLINFDEPSTSKFDDYHTMPNSETVSLNSTVYDSERTSSRMSHVTSLSNVECKTRTEDSYVFEAGYMLNLAARYEDMREYRRAFECYKAGIEKMLIGVQSDSDPQRRALIKEKTNKYLSYAEVIYTTHLCDVQQSLLPERDAVRPLHCPIPISMLKRPYEDLSLYRVIAVLGSSIMLVLHRGEQTCYAMKVIQKVPNNLTEFDEYFLQNTNETRQPILPTDIPYMVPLNSYIETNNLIFLILSYAPGEKLFDYIKNYAKSIPNTPAREVNLENVFTEPKIKHIDLENDNINSIITDNSMEATNIEINTSIIDRIEENVENNDNNNHETEIKTDKLENMEISVNELVINSQKLLLNVDKALSDVPKVIEVSEDQVKIEIVEEVKKKSVEIRPVESIERRIEIPAYNRLSPREVLPPSAVCNWGAEILTALESLHNSGVICRDLNPSNILLGDKGQVILTYFIHYPGLDMCLSKLQTNGQPNMYISPEIHEACMDVAETPVCDYWSFGAIMYELLCGVPLSYYHRSVFTSHTILHLPDGLSLEEQSLLTQLLTYSPTDRLGAGSSGITEIKRHPYFKHINWTHVYENCHNHD